MAERPDNYDAPRADGQSATAPAPSAGPALLRDVPAALWLGLPAASLLLVLLSPLALPEAMRWHRLIKSEYGVLQNLTVLFLLPAVVIGVMIFFRRRELPRGVGWVMLLGALAALYFAGEEVSWGQTYFRFGTPEALRAINKQREFNLHNTSNIFNNVPRQLMLVATVVGGCVLPLVLGKRLARPEVRQGPWYWLIPTWRLVPISLLAVLSNIPEKILRATGASPAVGSYLDLAVMEPGGEFKECCFALVMLLYLLSVYVRLRSVKAQRS